VPPSRICGSVPVSGVVLIIAQGVPSPAEHQAVFTEQAGNPPVLNLVDAI
jgi:hypothetical protein